VVPQTGCRVSTASSKAQLRITERTPDSRDALGWKWPRGEATSIADFGDPLTADTYGLCIYHQNGSAQDLVLRAIAPPGGSCRSRPCWRRVGARSVRYKDPDRTPDGLDSISLRAGVGGRAAIAVKGKGDALSAAGFPLPPPPAMLTVQLQATNGNCWESAFPPGQHSLR